MRLSGAERAGITGGVLLAAGLVTAAILYFWPDRPRPANPEAPDRPAVGTIAVKPAPPPVEPRFDPETETRVSDLRQEIRRLEDLVREKNEEIAALRGRLEEAGIPLLEAPPDPALVAEEVIRDLRKCGTETSAIEIERLVQRLVDAGEGAVDQVELAMAGDLDLAFSDMWSLSGGRFSSYPTLRVALLDALRQIGGVTGQAALLTILRKNEDPREICLIAGFLEKARGAPSVAEVLEERARLFLDLPPFRREILLVPPVLRILAAQEPARVAESLLAFIRPATRRPETASIAIGLISDLPPKTALATLARAATEPGLAEEKSVMAVEALAGRVGAEAVAALGEVLPKVAEEARRAAYRKLDDPPRAGLSRVRSLEKGLEALTELTRLEEDVAARVRLLKDRESAEKEHLGLVRTMEAARTRLGDVEAACGEIRKQLEGK